MPTLSSSFHWLPEKSTARPSRIRGLFAALTHEVRVRRALREVAALDDATLLDIGVSRDGIEDIVRHGRR